MEIKLAFPCTASESELKKRGRSCKGANKATTVISKKPATTRVCFAFFLSFFTQSCVALAREEKKNKRAVRPEEEAAEDTERLSLRCFAHARRRSGIYHPISRVIIKLVVIWCKNHGPHPKGLCISINLTG